MGFWGYDSFDSESAFGVGSYVYSPKRFFYGIFQGDGNFVIYRGAGPDDKHDALWETSGHKNLRPGAEPAGVTFFPTVYEMEHEFAGPRRLVCAQRKKGGSEGLSPYLWQSPEGTRKTDLLRARVQDDGNFQAYRDADPAHPFWSSNVTDPVTDYDIAKLDYNLDGMKILSALPKQMESQHVKNETSKPQTSTIAGSKATTTTSGWSDSLGIKVGVKTTLVLGIPMVFEGKVDVSMEVTNTFTWNGSTSEQTTFSWSTPITLDPGEEGDVLVTVTTSKIEVPYTLTGELVFKSGKRLSRRIEGTYTGENSHSLQVVLKSYRPNPGGVPDRRTRFFTGMGPVDDKAT